MKQGIARSALHAQRFTLVLHRRADEMLATLPDYVAFNGRPGQYQAEPIRVKRGDRVRFYVVDAGPTVPCAFHIVGEFPFVNYSFGHGEKGAIGILSVEP